MCGPWEIRTWRDVNVGDAATPGEMVAIAKLRGLRERWVVLARHTASGGNAAPGGAIVRQGLAPFDASITMIHYGAPSARAEATVASPAFG